ncbi:hypothetical protein RJZ90_007935 [Blastomyces dermatitidis]
MDLFICGIDRFFAMAFIERRIGGKLWVERWSDAAAEIVSKVVSGGRGIEFDALPDDENDANASFRYYFDTVVDEDVYRD